PEVAVPPAATPRNGSSARKASGSRPLSLRRALGSRAPQKSCGGRSPEIAPLQSPSLLEASCVLSAPGRHAWHVVLGRRPTKGYGILTTVPRRGAAGFARRAGALTPHTPSNARPCGPPTGSWEACPRRLHGPAFPAWSRAACARPFP